MPALPGLAPWLKPADETGNYLSGFQVAASAAQHAATLAAQQEEARQRIELARQVQQQNQLMEQQKLAITQQYHQQQSAINQQKAEQARQALEFRTKQAADRSSAMMEYQQRVAAGSDPTKTMMELGPRMSGGSLGGMGSILKQGAPPPQTKWVPPDQSSNAPGYVMDPRGNPHFPPGPRTPPLTQEQKDALEERKLDADIIKADIKKIDADLDLAEASGKEDVINRLNEKRASKLKELQNLFKSKGTQSDDGVVATYDPKTKSFVRIKTESKPSIPTPVASPTIPAGATPYSSPPLPANEGAVAPPPPEAVLPPAMVPQSAALPVPSVAPQPTLEPALNPNNLTPKLSGAELNYNPLDKIAGMIGSAAHRFLNPSEGQDPQAYALSVEQQKEEMLRRYREAYGEDFSD